jgi:hypothetical protein
VDDFEDELKTTLTAHLTQTRLVSLTLAFSVIAHAIELKDIFKDAAVLWHLDGLAVSSSITMKAEGEVKVGVELKGKERDESRARGGDGKVAVFEDGVLTEVAGEKGPLTLSISDDGLVFTKMLYLVGGRHIDYPHVIEHGQFVHRVRWRQTKRRTPQSEAQRCGCDQDAGEAAREVASIGNRRPTAAPRRHRLPRCALCRLLAGLCCQRTRCAHGARLGASSPRVASGWDCFSKAATCLRRWRRW